MYGTKNAANTLDALSDTMKAVSKWGDNPLKLVDGVATETASKALETGGDFARESQKAVWEMKAVVGADGIRLSTKADEGASLLKHGMAGTDGVAKSAGKTVNIDTGTANAFISQDSAIRHELKKYVKDKKMVMTETAVEEFKNIVNGAGGALEQARAKKFLSRITIIPDNPSTRAMNLQITKKVGVSDKIIFGTGDKLNIVTMTSDAKFVRGASAQGVEFSVYVHRPMPLTGR